MPHSSHPVKRTVAALAAVGVGVASLLLPAQAATAAPGTAPSPTEYRVLADVHTDAISTFLDDGQLTLATKADVDEGKGTRFEAEDVWFHVNDDAKVSLPAGFEFVAAEGAEVWLTPEAQNSSTLWPGFSTESVPSGTFDDNLTTLTLVDVAGPGDVELWSSGVFGGANRIWSSDEDFTVQTLNANQHKHANWAFTAEGTYALTVTAEAAVDGVTQSDTAIYTFVVGDLPGDVATETELSLEGPSTVTSGTPVAFEASVSPASVAGYVEFRRGDAVLGHEELVDGTARFETDTLSIGTHAVTATFVPAVANTADPSTSAPSSVVVTDAVGVEFSVAGVKDSYSPGETFTARAVGVDLADGQEVRWVHEMPNFDEPYPLDPVIGDTYTIDPIDAFYHGNQLRATVWDTASEAVVSQTDPVTISIAMEGSIPEFDLEDTTTVYFGEWFSATASGLEDIPDEATVRAVYSLYTRGDLAEDSEAIVDGAQWTFPAHFSTFAGDANLQLQVVRDDLVIAASPSYHIEAPRREALIQGAQSIYRAGQTLSVSATLFPVPDEDDADLFRWYFRSAETDRREYVEVEPDASGVFHFEKELVVGDDGGTLSFQMREPIGTGTFMYTTASASIDLKVTDTSSGEQLVAVNNLAAHYHQGDTISLGATADPAAADTDEFSWEWQFPGSDEWTDIPGVSGASDSIVAEQGLDGVLVRVNLHPTGGEEVFTSQPVTIDIDDHGAPARQVVSVVGETTYYEDQQLDLRVELPDDGQSILTDVLWEKKLSGADDWDVIEGASAATLSTAATVADSGASYRASLMTPAGQIAYGPSDAVTIQVIDVSSLTLVGIADEYTPGDTLRGEIVGYGELDDSEQLRWKFSHEYSEGGFWYGNAKNAVLEMPVDARHDQYTFVGAVYDTALREYVAETAPVTITVDNLIAAPTLTWTHGPDIYLGDTRTATITPSDEMRAGDEIVGAFRQTNAWATEQMGTLPLIDGSTLRHTPWAQFNGHIHANVMRDGVVIAVSDAYSVKDLKREVLFEGAQGVYRAGQTMDVRATVYPMDENLTFTWRFRDGDGSATTTEAVPDSDGVFRFTRDLALADDGGDLRLNATFPTSLGFDSSAGSSTMSIHVSDADPDTQLLAIDKLADHYHQGSAIALRLAADPALADTDVVSWEWKWPGGEWAPFPGLDSADEEVVAEQALDGVEVRAVVSIDGGDEVRSDAVTIYVDDHGAPARQSVSITGDEVVDGAVEFVDGTSGSFAADVTHGTVLDTYQWYVKLAGSSEFSEIHGATSATYDFTIDAMHDGAQVQVAVVTPDGAVAYGPSAPVSVTVTPGVDEPVDTTVTIAGASETYRVGDSMELTASQEPDSGESRWQWFVKPAGSGDFVAVSGATTSALTRAVTADDDGLQVLVRLYDDAESLVAESEPVTVVLDDDPGTGDGPGSGDEPGSGGDQPDSGKPSDAPAARSGDDLSGTPAGGIVLSDTHVEPGDSLSIDLGEAHADTWVAAWMFSTPTLLTGDWMLATEAGTVTVTIPADAEAGDHRIAVFDADGTLIGWAALTVGAGSATVTGLSATGGEFSPVWVALPIAAMVAGSALLVVRRRRGEV